MNARRTDFPKIWMATSLALLAIFLVLFLKKNYADERAALVKEVGYVFMGAVRGIEGDAIERLVRREAVFSENLPDLGKNFTQKDSFHTITFLGNGDKMTGKGEEKLEIRVERRGGPKSPSDLTGSISMIVARSENHGDSVAHFFQKEEFLPRLAANFDSAMSVAGLTVSHKILTAADSNILWENISTGSYTDLASGEQFTAQIADYQWFVLKKMMPNILFSLAVFGFVALAFLSIWRSLAEQKKMVLLKNDLLQNISHELKTPVSTVGVALEALGNFDALADKTRTREYLEISKNELARLSLLVDKVLGMAQFEKGKMPMQMAVFDFKKMVESVLAAMRLQFEKSGATIHFETTGDSFEMSGDELHLSGVVFNLLDNALKYSGLRPDIFIKTSSAGSEILLEIHDSGPGIPTEFRDKIFEKFFRIPTGARHDVKGHGLGLSYAAEVVRQHDGQIWVEGSSFFVQLKV